MSDESWGPLSIRCPVCEQDISRLPHDPGGQVCIGWAIVGALIDLRSELEAVGQTLKGAIQRIGGRF